MDSGNDLGSSSPDKMAWERGVCLKDILKAHQRISAHVHRTPVFTSTQADALSGRQLFFKAENLQKTGSFKVRGALNTILKLKENGQKFNGVITHSSGNHGQAVSLAAKMFGVPCVVVTPKMTQEVKKEAIRGYNAEVVECGPKPTDRQETCDKIRFEKNLEFIPPYDHYDVIAGQGTVAVELLEQCADLDAIFVTVSGGGLSSGIAIAAKAIKPDIKIYLVSPKGKGLEACLRAGQRLWEGPPQYLKTIADGITTQQTGQVTTPILMKLAEKEVFEMSDEEMIEATRFCFQRMKLVVEAAAGAAVAAVMSDRLTTVDPAGTLRRIGVILCGGNIDVDRLPWYTNTGPSRKGDGAAQA